MSLYSQLKDIAAFYNFEEEAAQQILYVGARNMTDNVRSTLKCKRMHSVTSKENI
jgi:hypothetical protein